MPTQVNTIPLLSPIKGPTFWVVGSPQLQTNTDLQNLLKGPGASP